MKTSERFDRAISALVKAYMNDTLAKGTCSACAVGNMIAASCGYKVASIDSDSWKNEYGRPIETAWEHVFISACNIQDLRPENYIGESKRQIDATGYTWEELARIEFAFERNTYIEHIIYKTHSKAKISEDQLRGLFAVVDVLCEIEGIADPAEYKALFAPQP